MSKSHPDEPLAAAMIDRFGDISHALRTPQSVILMWARLLDGGGLDDAGTRDAIDAILRSVETQRRLIDDLQDATRIATGQLRVTLEPIDLQALVRSAAETARPQAATKGVELRVDIDGLPATMPGDSQRLTQLVRILLDMALRITPAGGTVAVSASCEADQVLLHVSDRGPG